ncbi:phosphatidic acid phosphatase type 2/haloperoxidase, partial [Vararia minispora EC-137]
SGAFYALDGASGFKRDFSVDDPSSVYAVHQRVPLWALYLICLVAPIVLQWFISIFTIRSWLDVHHSTLGVLLSLAITGVITQFMKITAGRPRPDLLNRCGVVIGTVDPPYGLSAVAICTQTNGRILEDGFRSFPSGHSSLSFAGLAFLSFYLAGKLRLFQRPVRGHALKAWICVAPLCGAALVAITRTMDYRHHWQDVFVGGALGFVVAYFSYRLYYPPLTAKFSHRPYGPR